MAREPGPVLRDGLAALGLALGPQPQARLVAYVALLARWNRTYNLTAVRDPVEMVTRHLLDSLAVLPHLDGQRFLDFGTGAGLPGIPLAIARPQWSFTLVDSNGKKVRFVRQAVLELGLRNVAVTQARVEALAAERFDGLVVRAVSALPRLLQWTAALRAAGATLYALKGALEPDEEALLPTLPHRRIGLEIPGSASLRQLVVVAPG